MYEEFSKNSGIYCFENIINNKKYIGQADNLRKRIRQHITMLKGEYDGCLALQHSWSFYGKENFIIYTIEECEKEKLNEREVFWIKELHSHTTEGGLNISFGGDSFFEGRHHSEESKKKISENSKVPTGETHWSYGKSLSEEEKQNLSEKMKEYYKTHRNANFGKHFGEETRQKMSESRKGKKIGPMSQEQKDKISDSLQGNIPWNKGIPMSEESKEKLSNSLKGKFSGENNPMYGKKHSEATRKKLSESHTGKKQSEEQKRKKSEAMSGDKNPNFGKKMDEEQKIAISKTLQGKKRKKDSSSKYVGVSFSKQREKWISVIKYSGKLIRIGSFLTEKEAALAYNAKAIEFYGESANLNIIEEEDNAI